jgi:hypothetical protein
LANVISPGLLNNCWPLAIVCGLMAPAVGAGIIPAGLNAVASLDASLTPAFLVTSAGCTAEVGTFTGSVR